METLFLYALGNQKRSLWLVLLQWSRAEPQHLWGLPVLQTYMETYCLIVLETESSDSRQGWFPLRTVRENFLQVSLLGSNSLGHSLACRWCSPCFSIFPCVSVCVQMSPFHKDASHIGSLLKGLGWADPLEEGTAPLSSILAWGNPMDRGARRTTVHGITKSRTQLSD